MKMNLKPISYFVLLMLPFFGSKVYAQKQKQSDEQILIRQIKQETDVNHNYDKALRMVIDAAKKYPDEADFRYLLGRLYYLNNNLSKAEVVLDDVIKNAPDYRAAYVMIATVELALKQPAKAFYYLNLGQKRFPRDYPIRNKKLSIYQAAGQYRQADMYADSLITLFPRDTSIRRLYINYRVEAGTIYLKQGLSTLAKAEFDKVLAIDPQNRDASQGVLNGLVKSGDNQNSLNFVNSQLIQNPKSYDLLMKKIGLLQDEKQYAEAIETVKLMNTYFPGNPKGKQLETDLSLEAARYYKSTDPYAQYQSVLERNPGNAEALSNVINIAISRGLYDDALGLINKSLSKNAFNKELLTQKMSILIKQGKNIPAAEIAEKLYRNSASVGNKQTYIDVSLDAARDYALEEMPDSALYVYGKVLALEPSNERALNSSVNLLAGKKDYDRAIALLDKTIGYYPNAVQLKIKKASILQESGRLDEAAQLYNQIYNINTEDEKSRNGVIEANLVIGKQMMEVMDYDKAAEAYSKVLTLDPTNKVAINNITNIDLAIGGTYNLEAYNRLEEALNHYPNDKDLLMKKVEVLNRLDSLTDASLIADSLHRNYPYNTQIRSLYQDQQYLMATYYRGLSDTVSAITSYQNLLTLTRKDTIAWLGLYNIRYEQAQYEEAVKYTDTALHYFPGNTIFILKRASALEQLKQYTEAAQAMDTVIKAHPYDKNYQDYAAYLRGKTYKNQIGLSYLNSHIDSAQSANIATLQYTHFWKKISLTARLNFAGRSFGTGLQGELESYVNHSKNWYSYVNVAVANELVFPKYKAGYSLFHNFNHGWEVELGGRYLNFDSISSMSGVLAVAKYLGDFWINVKGYGVFISGKQYTAVNLTARQYLNNKTDFFYAILGYGNSPDDFTRSYLLVDNVNYTTYSIGAGYQKMFNYRNVVTLSGTWYNQKREEGRYRNQYDLYLTFLRKF